MKPAFAISLLLIVGAGCKRSHEPERHVSVISDGASVPITYLPEQPKGYEHGYAVASYIGNVSLLARIFKVDGNESSTVIMYVKTISTGEWESAVCYYDSANHEIRFREAHEGWAYCVYVFTPKEELL